MAQLLAGSDDTTEGAKVAAFCSFARSYNSACALPILFELFGSPTLTNDEKQLILEDRLHSGSFRVLQDTQLLLGVELVEPESPKFLRPNPDDEDDKLDLLRWFVAHQETLTVDFVCSAIVAKRPRVLDYLLEQQCELPDAKIVFAFFTDPSYAEIYECYLANPLVAAHVSMTLWDTYEVPSVVAAEFVSRHGPPALLSASELFPTISSTTSSTTSRFVLSPSSASGATTTRFLWFSAP